MLPLLPSTGWAVGCPTPCGLCPEGPLCPKVHPEHRAWWAGPQQGQAAAPPGISGPGGLPSGPGGRRGHRARSAGRTLPAGIPHAGPSGWVASHCTRTSSRAYSRVSGSVGLSWGLSIYISRKFQPVLMPQV